LIDRTFLELAEYASLRKLRGYQTTEPPYAHPLEELPVLGSDGKPARKEELVAIWEEAKARLRGLKGKPKTIDGQIYVDIDEYRKWDARTVEGDLNPTPGVPVAGWNRWLKSRRGDGNVHIAGITLRRLRAPFGLSDFVECEDERDLRVKTGARQFVLDRIHGAVASTTEPVDQSALRKTLECLLVDSLAIRELVKQAENRFGGHKTIFPEDSKQLEVLLSLAEGFATKFNSLESAIRMFGAGSHEHEIAPDAARAKAKSMSQKMFNRLQKSAEARAYETLGRPQAAKKVLWELLSDSRAKMAAPNADLKGTQGGAVAQIAAETVNE